MTTTDLAIAYAAGDILLADLRALDADVAAVLAAAAPLCPVYNVD